MPISVNMMLQSLTNPAAAVSTVHDRAAEPLLRELKSVAEIDVTKMNAKEKAELMDKCQEFESLFVKMLLDTMRKSIDRAKSESGSMQQGKDIYEEMLYGEYAKDISRTGAFGVGAMIYRQLTTPVIPASEISRRYTQS